MNQISYSRFPQAQSYTDRITGFLIRPQTYQGQSNERFGGLGRFSTLFGGQEDQMNQSQFGTTLGGIAMSPEDEVKQKLAPQNYRVSVSSSGGNIRGSIAPSLDWYRSIQRLPFPEITRMGGAR